MGPTAMEDVELGALARAGDMEAMAGLLERYRPSLYAAAIGLLGNRCDALDAVQDTCVVALVRLGDLREAGTAKRWLHSVLRNVCLRRIRQRREVPSDGVDELTAVAPSPEELFERSSVREWVWQAIATLSPDEQLTVMLRYFTRCTSYDAIARITAVPVGTVRSRLNRARASGRPSRGHGCEYVGQPRTG